MSKVVTANVLATGAVVFVARDGGWTQAIAEARIFPDADSAEDGLDAANADAAKAIVVDPFVTDAGPATEGRSKMSLRDTIRAYGPTIQFLPTDAKVARG